MKRTALRGGRSRASRLYRECDDLSKRLVKHRDKWRCRKCGSDFIVQAAHILPRGRYPKLKFDLENIVTLCRSCHMRQGHMSYPQQREFFESIVGTELIPRLEKRNRLLRGTNLAATAIWLRLWVTQAGC